MGVVVRRGLRERNWIDKLVSDSELLGEECPDASQADLMVSID